MNLKNILIVIAVGALLVALVVIGILAYNNLKSKPNPTPQATTTPEAEPGSSARPPIKWYP